MTISSAMQMLSDYGEIVMFVLAMLEAMNCPGMPAGIMLPAAGIFAAQNGNVQRLALVYSAMVVGSLIGCMVLYCVGAIGGRALERWLNKHSGKHSKKIEHYMEKIHNGGWWTICLCRMVPVVRTLGSFMAGISRMDLKNYIIGTAAGVAVYNAIGIGLGYFAGWIFI